MSVPMRTFPSIVVLEAMQGKCRSSEFFPANTCIWNNKMLATWCTHSEPNPVDAGRVTLTSFRRRCTSVQVVDSFWFQISSSISLVEGLFEDPAFPGAPGVRSRLTPGARPARARRSTSTPRGPRALHRRRPRALPGRMQIANSPLWWPPRSSTTSANSTTP